MIFYHNEWKCHMFFLMKWLSQILKKMHFLTKILFCIYCLYIWLWIRTYFKHVHTVNMWKCQGFINYELKQLCLGNRYGHSSDPIILIFFTIPSLTFDWQSVKIFIRHLYYKKCYNQTYVTKSENPIRLNVKNIVVITSVGELERKWRKRESLYRYPKLAKWIYETIGIGLFVHNRKFFLSFSEENCFSL